MSGSSFAQKLCSSLKLAVTIFLCLIVWTVFLIPILLPPLLILFLLRKCVDFVVLSLHPDWKPITGLDSLHGSATTQNYTDKEGHCFANIGTCLIVEGQVSADELRNKFEQSIFNLKVTNNRDWKYWKLRCKPTQCFGYSYWAPLAQINLRDYFKEWPSEGETGVEQDFNYVINEWVPLGFGERSPWEFLIFVPQVGKFAGKSMVFVKMNHVVGDGVSIRYLLLKLLDLKEDDQIQPNLIKASLLEQIYDTITVPRVMLSVVKVVIQSKREAATTFGNISNNGEMLTVFDYVDVHSVKNAKRKLNCSFREALSTALGSALRTHLIDSNNYAKLPTNLVVFHNMHWPYSAHPEESLRNHATSIIAKYPMEEQSSMKRIASLRQDMNHNFKIGVHKLNYYSSKLAYIFNPGCLTSRVVKHSLAPYLAISDIPSSIDIPMSAYQLVGKQISAIYGTLTLGGVPMLCAGTFITVGTKLCVSLIANKAIVYDSSNLEKIFKNFKDEILWMGADSAEQDVTESTILEV